MNELQIFKNDLFGEVRTVLLNNEVWFVLIDICKALGLTNPSMVALRLDEDEVTKFDLGSLSGITKGCDYFKSLKEVAEFLNKNGWNIKEKHRS